MSYLQFEPHGRSASGKTLIVAVRDRAGSPLGAITWYAPWRKYVFEARPDTVWDASCLRDVAAHCEAMTTAHGLEGPALPAPEPSPLERPTLYSEMLEALAWMAKLAETDEGAAIVLNRLRQRVAEVRSSIPVRAAPEGPYSVERGLAKWHPKPDEDPYYWNVMRAGAPDGGTWVREAEAVAVRDALNRVASSLASAPELTPQPPVLDLMAALKASLAVKTGGEK